jgi:hypothetical protein
MYSTQRRRESKFPVNISYQGKLICSHRMTIKEVDRFIDGMREKGYEMEVTYNGKP